MATAEPLLNGSNGIHMHSPQLDGPDGPVPPTPNPASVTPAPPFDAGALRAYLAVLLPVLLGASPADLEPLLDAEFTERAPRFAAEGGGPLYVVKVKGDVEGAFVCCSISPTCFQLLTILFALFF